jgi:hypothetical protein
MLVDSEILTHFVEQTYLDPTGGRVFDEMLDKEIAPGLKLGDLVSRERLRERLLAQLELRDRRQEATRSEPGIHAPAAPHPFSRRCANIPPQFLEGRGRW